MKKLLIVSIVWLLVLFSCKDPVPIESTEEYQAGYKAGLKAVVRDTVYLEKGEEMILADILDTLSVLTEFDKADYQELPYENIEGKTDKAVKFDGHWIPISQLRCDFEKNIYISVWLYTKIF